MNFSRDFHSEKGEKRARRQKGSEISMSVMELSALLLRAAAKFRRQPGVLAHLRASTQAQLKDKLPPNLRTGTGKEL